MKTSLKRNLTMAMVMLFLMSIMMAPVTAFAGTTTKYDKQISAVKKKIQSETEKQQALKAELSGLMNGGRYVEIYDTFKYDETRVKCDVTSFDSNCTAISWDNVIVTSFATGDLVKILDVEAVEDGPDAIAFASAKDWDVALNDNEAPLIVSPVSDAIADKMIALGNSKTIVEKLKVTLEALNCKKLGYVKQESDDYSGEYYYGQVKNGLWHGFGEYHFESGNVISGKFYKGSLNMNNVVLKCSYDEETGGWAYIYSGELTDDDDAAFTGFGTLEYFVDNTDDVNVDYFASIREEYPTATKYVGEFDDNKFNGEGKLYSGETLIYTGYFLDGEVTGAE